MSDLKARLVEEAGDKLRPTQTREVSSIRGAVRALADYLRTLTFPVDGGQHTRFSVVREMKAEVEQDAKYPAAAVYPDGVIDYDADTGSLEQYQIQQFRDGGLYINGDVRTELSVHVWTDADFTRENILMCLEDAFNPVNWMTGFSLEMPFYYNLRADYLLLRVQYEDAPDDVQRRYRKLMVTVRVTCPCAQHMTLPELRAYAQSRVEES
ncbi:MAG: hypothetical protein E6Q97_19555 [Desulfurellales bacterium]|nr:MAG: hypothetical protein E6Q97_19555 [Desulfurellales bacterium]